MVGRRAEGLFAGGSGGAAAPPGKDYYCPTGVYSAAAVRVFGWLCYGKWACADKKSAYIHLAQKKRKTCLKHFLIRFLTFLLTFVFDTVDGIN